MTEWALSVAKRRCEFRWLLCVSSILLCGVGSTNPSSMKRSTYVHRFMHLSMADHALVPQVAGSGRGVIVHLVEDQSQVLFT